MCILIFNPYELIIVPYLVTEAKRAILGNRFQESLFPEMVVANRKDSSEFEHPINFNEYLRRYPDLVEHVIHYYHVDCSGWNISHGFI